jgi:hypothetical protein
MAGQYLLLFDFDAPDKQSFDRLQQEVGKIESGLSADIGMLSASFTYEPLGPKLLGEQVKRERAQHPDATSSRTLSAEEVSLAETDSRRFRAMVDRGIPELERTLADELVYVHSSDMRQSKEEHLGDTATGKAVYRRIDINTRMPELN